ncbi:MAG: hypothetical protein V1668_00910 [Patescibacteria group bacterium]
MEHVPHWLVEALSAEAVSAANVKKAAKQLSPIEEGEKVIGEITDSTKRVYAAWMAQIDAVDSIKEKHVAEHNSPDHTRGQCEQFEHDLMLAMSKYNALKELFWTSARVDLNAPGSVGIRKDWKLVKVEDKPQTGISIVTFC